MPPSACVRARVRVRARVKIRVRVRVRIRVSVRVAAVGLRECVELEPHAERHGAALRRVGELDKVITAVEHDALADGAPRAIDEARVHSTDLVGKIARVEAERVAQPRGRRRRQHRGIPAVGHDHPVLERVGARNRVRGRGSVRVRVRATGPGPGPGLGLGLGLGG